MAGLGGVLSGLRDVTGASYVCVVERDSALVLGQVGGNDGEAVDIGSVAALGRSAGNMFGGSGIDDVEDLMVSSRQSFHVVRQIEVPAGPVVLVYLRLMRGRANAAMARRELASAQIQRTLIEALTARPKPQPEPVASVIPLPRRNPERPTPTSTRTAPPAPPAPPRSPAALPVARSPLSVSAAGPQQPALAILSGTPPASALGPNGAVAAIDQVKDSQTPQARSESATPGPPTPTLPSALPTPTPDSSEDAVLQPLPRRSVGSRLPPAPPPRGSAGHSGQDGGVPSGPTQAWARDLSTMQRLVAGLRRLV